MTVRESDLGRNIFGSGDLDVHGPYSSLIERGCRLFSTISLEILE
jgi:hypothetical protein